ncbi:hypothetical protein PINS_up013757 [Pythium insidiosum]|nr:hypothetical protein PINS_up013757 [Pythium insidiosum]
MNMMRVKSFTQRPAPPPVVAEEPIASVKGADDTSTDANGTSSNCGDPKSDSPRQPTISISAYSEAAVTETMILESLADPQRTQTETVLSLEPSPPKALRPKKRLVSSSPTASSSSSKASSTRRSSAPTRFFQKVMRGQFSSDADATTSKASKWSKREDTNALGAAASAAGAEVSTRPNDDSDDDGNDDDGDDDVLRATASHESSRATTPTAGAASSSSSTSSSSSSAGGQDAVYAALGDVFLNSSLQMLQVQSEAKQRVRQLWATTQRLRVENQLSDAALDALHQELLSVMKGLMIEKLEGVRHVKSGYLTLVQAPPSLLLPLARRGAGAIGARSLLFGPGKASLEQRVWASLSDEQCRLEIVPARDDNSDHVAGPSTSSSSSASTSSSLPPLSGAAATFPGLARFKLPTTISWLLSDPVPHASAAHGSEDAAIARTTLRLQGCQVRRMPIIAGTGLEATRPRFQVLVPTRDSSNGAANSAAALATTGGGGVHDASGPPSVIVPEPPSPHSSFAIYVFEVNESEDADANEREANEWVAAIDRVCLFQLYMLELALRDAPYMLQFRDLLERHFPVSIPLSWLRNRLERAPPTAHGAAHSSSSSSSSSASAASTVQQRAAFQQQQLQRRSSRNLSMVQIIKDLERDRILIDQQLLIASATAASAPSNASSSSSSSSSDRTRLEAAATDGRRTKREHDNIAEIVKYLVAKAMAFARRSADAAKARSASSPGSPGSPSNRLTKLTEAKALAFIERVLRGSSRTQSGGDIYDAISFFCQQRHLSICPVSQDANPVVMNVVEDEENAAFHVHIEVTMQFKIVELGGMATPPPRARHLQRVDQAALDMVASSPREWAVMEGTLTRQFTLGKTSEPGTVTIRYIPSPDDSLSAETAEPTSASSSD